MLEDKIKKKKKKAAAWKRLWDASTHIYMIDSTYIFMHMFRSLFSYSTCISCLLLSNVHLFYPFPHKNTHTQTHSLCHSLLVTYISSENSPRACFSPDVWAGWPMGVKGCLLICLLQRSKDNLKKWTDSFLWIKKYSDAKIIYVIIKCIKNRIMIFCIFIKWGPLCMSHMQCLMQN